MAEILPQQVVDYLAGHHVMTLATQGPDGPWAAAVFFAHEGESLYFLSSPNSRHCRNLAQDSRCAATIHEDYADWREIKGIQVDGRVSELHGDQERRARQIYADKFPLIGRLAGAPQAIVEALNRVRWYRLQPDRFYFIDNSRGFGHRDEIALGSAR